MAAQNQPRTGPSRVAPMPKRLAAKRMNSPPDSSLEKKIGSQPRPLAAAKYRALTPAGT